MSKKEKVRDFKGTMNQFYESLNKGFYRAFDEDNSKIMNQVIHEENLVILRLLACLAEDSEDAMEKFMRINQ